MNKRLLVAFILIMLFLCGCNKSSNILAEEVNNDDDAISEESEENVVENNDSEEEADDESDESILADIFLENESDDEDINKTSYIGNPWVDSNRESILATLGLDMVVPDGATDIDYQMSEEVGLGQVTFSYGDTSLDFTYRMKKSDEFEDISGLYYEWDVEDDIYVEWCEGKCWRVVTDDETIDACLWFDEELGIMCCLSTSAPDLDGFDITAIAQLIYAKEE